MTTAPSVELSFNPTDLRPRDLPSVGSFLGSPADAIEASLAVTRAAMVDEMRTNTRGLAEPTRAQLVRIADLAWEAVFWKFRKISAPVMADAYIRAYQKADAGDVPTSVIYDLADKHAEKIGDYFHASSREALAEGFTTMVNRRLPAKAAAERVLDAYGLTSRQMRGYVSAQQQFNTPISDVLPRSLKAKARAYIDKAFTTRTRKLSRQEEHNISQQAQQFAWMWLQDKGRMPQQAEKMWVTAHDERVCPICGPLHGQKVEVGEQFVTKEGSFWTPGLHPNCRCEVRLMENTFSKAEWDAREHPRGGPINSGRFRRVLETERKREVIDLPKPTILETLTELEPEEEKLSMVQAPAEEQLSMSTGKLSMGRLSMTGSLSMGDENKLSMTAPAKADKLSMTGSRKISMTRDQAQKKLSMMVTPEMQMQMDRTFDLAMSMSPYQAPRPRPKPSPVYRPTIAIQDDNGHAYPVYAVTTPRLPLNWGQGQVELTHQVSFTPSLDIARGWAADEFQQQIINAADGVVENGLDLIAVRDESGRQWTADLDYTEVLDVASWAAYQGRVSDPDTSAVDFERNIELSDSSGSRRSKTYHISQLAKMLEVGPEDFDVRILRMDEGHDSVDGSTMMDHAGTKHGYENWVTSGVYNAVPVRTEDVGHNLALKIYWIEPDVKDYSFDGLLD